MKTYDEVINFITNNNLQLKYHLKRIGLFGSILDKDNPNDIDVLIEEYSDHKDLIKFQDELEHATGKSVDLVIEKYASPIILYRAKRNISYVS
ncbi:MAG: nucleotidyltransferase domain-containing protein [Spirochaetaceae bacterium]